jgi:hypothetical protein
LQHPGSSLKKPTWFAYEALLLLLQHHESRGSRSTLTNEGDDVSIFSNSVSVWNLRDFRLPPRCVGETCALLGYYAAFSCISVPTFRDNLWVPERLLDPWRWKGVLLLEMGPIGFPEMSVQNYHSTLRNIAAGRISCLEFLNRFWNNSTK